MTCITSPTYSLNVNGNTFGFFPGKRGIEARDPLSPLIFTLCMEYLSRILVIVGQQEGFRFHPMCGYIRLNHLLFADDLLLFCKGNAVSIMWLLRGFSTFSATSGLVLNNVKTDIYFSGVSKELIEDIVKVSGFRIGTLPFKYLGVPISSKKISKFEGHKLIERIVQRIRCLGARKLSYAGRLVLVKTVLSTLHSYWASMFLIPSGIMNKVDSICRNFLWGGRDSYLKAPNINWNTCCKPKAEGGLGLKNAKLWNKALLGKYTSWLASKKDHLWVKWVNHVYMKGCDWKDYTSPTNCSWSWRKIMQVKDIFKIGYANNQWIAKLSGYSVADGYNWLRDTSPQVPWRYLCWNNLNVPRTSFIFWASQHGKLLTLDRLHKMGIVQSTVCFICGSETESHEHLFYKCEYSKRCMQLMQQKPHIQFHVEHMVKWYSLSRSRSSLQRVVIGAYFVGLIYGIWHVRNCARLQQQVQPPSMLVNQVWKEVKDRWLHRNKRPLRNYDQLWIDSIS
ncbi:uncharacterized protein LOC141657465 [Silene latifolia]|uniref:uncharacterized protein LOC141657465 n=1 Tax=Silene latifolia TaxID=37657 RepID=UPI003D76F924